MPAGGIAEVLVRIAARVAVGAAAEVVPHLIFNRFVASYFHGVGRRAIAIFSLGRIRIPSSLRDPVKGERPKPSFRDWVALYTGIAIGGAVVAVGLYVMVWM